MNCRRIASLIAVPAASAALLLGASGIANAATPTPTPALGPAATAAPSPEAYGEGAVNIDLTISNNTDGPMTLTWNGLSGSLSHWDKRPQTTLAAHSSEEITGYSHNDFAELDMAMTYETGTGDLASFAVQANTGGMSGTNTTTGTGVTQDSGQPATDLTTTATVTQPGPTDNWDHAVATMSLDSAK